MPKQKPAPPAIRRFSFRVDPANDPDGETYSAQLAEAERKAGCKVSHAHTRRVRVLGFANLGRSINHRNRLSTVRTELVRTFIFR